MEYTRFVAIGDSQTEGLGDPIASTSNGQAIDADYEFRGWADRLAERIAELQPQLRYANLAVRGKNTRQSRDEQLEPALELAPDLVAAPLGMNDVIGSSRMSAVHADLDYIYGRLAGTGATVIVSTFPDVTKTIPMGQRLADRLLELNEMTRAFAATYGFVLVDLYSAPVLTDLRAWSTDRLHASPLGHARFADGAAFALGLPGSSADWGRPLPPIPPRHPLVDIAVDTRWAIEFFTPWIIRRLRGVSLGDGRRPKRPLLTPVTALPVDPSAAPTCPLGD